MELVERSLGIFGQQASIGQAGPDSGIGKLPYQKRLGGTELFSRFRPRLHRSTNERRPLCPDPADETTRSSPDGTRGLRS